MPYEKELIAAIKKGDLVEVQAWLDKGATVEARDIYIGVDTTGYDYTALYLAAYLEYADIARALIARGANIESVDKYGNTVLIQATANGCTAVIERLLKAGAKVNATNEANETALHWIAYACRPQRADDEKIALLLLQHGADPTIKNARGETAAIAATLNKDTGDKGAKIAALIQGYKAMPILLQSAQINPTTSSSSVELEKKNAIIAAVKARNVSQLHTLLIGEKELSLNYSGRGAEGARDVGDAGVKVVTDAISKGGLILEKLEFGGTGITDMGAQTIAEALRYNKHVKHICFSYNQISDSGVTAIANALNTNTVLETLDLGANIFSNAGAEKIAAMLQINNTLKFLHVGCPPVTAACIPAFITALEKNTSLCNLIGNDHFFTKNPVLAAYLKRNEEKRVSPKEFIEAAEKGISAILELGIDGGIDVNSTINPDGWTALHQAASYNQVAVIKLLIQKGNANFEVQNTKGYNIGWRPLHCATWNGRKEATMALLEAGAEPTAKTANTVQEHPNKTPTELAAFNGFTEIPALIQSFQTKPLHATQENPLSSLSSPVALDALLKKSEQGVLNKKRDIRALLIKGAIPWPIDKNGRSPLHLAVENGHLNTIACLIDFFTLQPPFKENILLEPDFRKTLINVQDAAGDTALHIAVRKAINDKTTYLPIVKFLIQSGADVCQKNKEQKPKPAESPRDIALSSAVVEKNPTLNDLFKKLDNFEKGKKELWQIANMSVTDSDKQAEAEKWFIKYGKLTDISGNSYLCWVVQLQNKCLIDFFCDYCPKQAPHLKMTLKDLLYLQNEVGNTALHIAVISKSTHFICRLFNDHCIVFDRSLLTLENKKRQTIPMLCFKYGNGLILRLLLTKLSPSNLNIPLDSFVFLKGHNPAHLAALSSNLEAIDRLNIIAYEKYFGLIDEQGNLPIHYAAKYGYTDILCYLVLHFPDLRDKVDRNGNPPLYIAIERGEVDAVKYLIAAGSSLDIINNKGEKAFNIAKKTGSKDLIGLIEEIQKYNPAPQQLCIEINDEVFQGGGIKGVAYMGSMQGICNTKYITSQYFKRNTARIYGASAGGITTLLLGLGFGVETDVRATELNTVTEQLNFDLLLKNKEDSDPKLLASEKYFREKFLNFKESGFNLDGVGTISLFLLLIKYARKFLKSRKIEAVFQGSLLFTVLPINIAGAIKVINRLYGADKLEKELCKCLGLKDGVELEQFVRALAEKLNEQKGIFDAHAVREWFEKIIEERTTVDGKKISNITFEELAKLAEEHPKLGIKGIAFVAVNLSTNRTQVFSLSDTPDVVIADAVLASMSIPGFFTPCRIRRKPRGSAPITVSDLYVDGGLYDNYPAWISQRNKTHHFLANDKVLGFRLVTAEQKYLYEYSDVSLLPKPIHDIQEYVKNICTGYLNKQESDHAWNKTEQDYTVYNYHQDHSPVDFDIGSEQRQYLQRSGYLGLFGFLARRFIRNYELALNNAKENQPMHTIINSAAEAAKPIATASPQPNEHLVTKPQSPRAATILIAQNRYFMSHQKPWLTLPLTFAATAAGIVALSNADIEDTEEKLTMTLK